MRGKIAAFKGLSKECLPVPGKIELVSEELSNDEMAMRIFVKICCGNTATEPQTYAISCNPTASIESLKSQAFARWLENSSENSERNSDQFRLWLSGTPALLSDKDKIQNVLREGDFVILCELAQ